MSSFAQISASFRGLKASLKPRINSVLHEEGQALLVDFRERSPVDTGFYKSNWQLLKSRFTSSNTISSITLRNPTSYAIYMEEGAKENKAPWFYSTGKKYQSGKLTIQDGRVWAGGLAPGHSKTIGGAIRPALFENEQRLSRLTNKIADAIIGGFK